MHGNRRRVLHALLKEGQGELASLYQVHGTRTIVVDHLWPEDSRPQADAAMVTKPSKASRSANPSPPIAGPVLFADAQAGVIGAVHAGWKGALSGVTDSVIAQMEALGGAKRERIAAAIGPCISQAAYEVGPEFRERFLVADSQHAQFFVSGDDGHWQRSILPGFLRQRLAAAGLGSVEDLGCCTYEHPEAFFSYRRTTHRGEPDYGRQVSARLRAHVRRSA